MKALGYLLLILALLVANGACIQYTCNEWLIFTGKESRVSLLGGTALGLVPLLGQLGIPGAVVTWILIPILEE